MNEIRIGINVPTDNDGYILLKCQYCGTYFKTTPSDYQDEGTLFIYCPCCGLSGDNYITEDIINLATAISVNFANDLVFSELKKMESQFKNGLLQFKIRNKPKNEPENPIRSGIEALTISYFRCCKREAKIKPMLKIVGCYCPFCGVKDYDIK